MRWSSRGIIHCTRPRRRVPRFCLLSTSHSLPYIPSKFCPFPSPFPFRLHRFACWISDDPSNDRIGGPLQRPLLLFLQRVLKHKNVSLFVYAFPKLPSTDHHSWNCLDFIIVCLGYIEFMPILESKFTAIRAVRVLRPLRSINSIPGMRILVASLLRALSMMGNVLVLAFFTFLLFGLMGMQLFHGTISMNGGITNFDDIAHSWLTILQCVSLEGWIDGIYPVLSVECAIEMPDCDTIRSSDLSNFQWHTKYRGKPPNGPCCSFSL